MHRSIFMRELLASDQTEEIIHYFHVQKKEGKAEQVKDVFMGDLHRQNAVENAREKKKQKLGVVASIFQFSWWAAYWHNTV